MPDRKKPSRAPVKGAAAKRAPAKATAAKRAPAKPAARKATTTSTRKPAAKQPAKKPTAARARRAPADDLEPLDLDGLEFDEAEAQDDDAAVEVETDAVEVADDEEPSVLVDHDFGDVAIASGPFVDHDEAPGIPQLIRFEEPQDDRPLEPELGLDRPREEFVVGIAALLLGASVFLPWFGVGQFKITGWSAGLWGPVIAFLSLAVVATVALRRFRVPIAFPIDHAAIFEVVGWLAVLGLLASRFFGVEVDGVEHAAQRIIFVPIALAAALAMLAGRVSSGSPFVVRPGWHRGTAGKVGAGVLALALAGGVGFGMTGAPVFGGGPAKTRPQTKTFRGVLPPCAKAAKFPTPAGVKYATSYELPTGLCQITFSSTLSIAKLTATYKAALKASGWTFTAVPAPGSITFTLRKPRCGALNISEPASGGGTAKAKTRTGIAFFQTQCSTPTVSGTQPPN